MRVTPQWSSRDTERRIFEMDLSPETAKVLNQSTAGELPKDRVPIDDDGALRGRFGCARYFGCVAAGNDAMSESENLDRILAHERICEACTTGQRSRSTASRNRKTAESSATGSSAMTGGRTSFRSR
jgi:hypothetical protein